MKKSVMALLAGLMMIAGSAFAAGVNLNTADKNELMSLTGVGASKAEAIIAYRKASGPFKSVEDLQKVQGIGPATLEKNAGNMTVAAE